MKQFKIILASLILLTFVGASAFNNSKMKKLAINDYYKVTVATTSVTTTTQINTTPLTSTERDEFDLDTHCPTQSANLCIVKQTGVSTYSPVVLFGTYQ
ncbi:hypothetical protein HB364_20595 [Pseudoflavitalea sp. X16]|uniref:hypothetical protein n=1 Tax=Paraflavitalea devenefica TaxID=2716334 RepID=UPI001420DC4E|nr:hypothetical protein [Paraflavitalea devenefica]NII27500.1 hypothetical protein [Paraflavitalea devenefica]